MTIEDTALPGVNKQVRTNDTKRYRKIFPRAQAGLAAVKSELTSHSQSKSNDEHLLAAIDWLCHSQDVTMTGGSAATYNLVLGWEAPYPETTGYIIPTMFDCAEALDQPAIRDRAIRMADWLIEIQHPEGSFPGGTGECGDPNVFNTGQIVFGLAEAYKETGDRRYKIALREACDWLVKVQSSEGYWNNFDYKGQVHVYTTRVAWALIKAADILSDRRESYRGAARRTLNWAIQRQGANGWFKNAAFEADSKPYLHTIAYTIRGLLEGGFLLSQSTYVNAAQRTAKRLLSIQESQGILKGAYNNSWSPSWYYCLTGNAQMAIVWLRLFAHTNDNAYRAAACRSIEFLKYRQILNGPPDVRGGLAGSYPLFGPYMYLRFPNWAVKFFIDALLIMRNHSPSEESSCSA